MAQATIARPPAPEPTPQIPAAWAARLEPAALAALVTAAVLVRLPYLWLIPQFSDESMDSLRSLSLYQGQRFPLTNVSDYVGGLYNWLEALGFRLLGVSPYTPRLWVCLLGGLAVAATYFLAREMAGRAAGWIAAGLLATSGVHIGGNSHVAWSQETTPLFLALTLLLLYRSVTRQSGASLLGAGFLGGLTLQTHPTVIAFLPGAGLYLLWKGRALLRSRWPYLAVCLFLLGYSNVIVYNAATGFQSIKTARTRDAEYGDYRSRDFRTYLLNEGRILLTMVRLPGGAVDARPQAADYLTDPQVVVYLGLAAAGLVMLCRSGNPLPLFVVLTAAIVFPVFGARHDLLPRQGRYLAPLLPLLFTALALAVGSLAVPVSGWLVRRGASVRTRRLVGILAVGLLIGLPLLPLRAYYADSVAAGETNERFFNLLARIEASRRNDELVVLDTQLDQEHLGGGGTTMQTMDFMLATRGIPHQEMTVEPDRLVRRFGGSSIVLVLGEKTYRNQSSLIALQPPPGEPAVMAPDPYGVYLVASTGGP